MTFLKFFNIIPYKSLKGRHKMSSTARIEEIKKLIESHKYDEKIEYKLPETNNELIIDLIRKIGDIAEKCNNEIDDLYPNCINHENLKKDIINIFTTEMNYLQNLHIDFVEDTNSTFVVNGRNTEIEFVIDILDDHYEILQIISRRIESLSEDISAERQ